MLSDIAQVILNDRYVQKGEKPEEIFKRVADHFGSDKAHSKRLLDYMHDGWFLPATPILSNGGTNRGLPISCFLNHVDDSRQGLSNHYDEVLWMATSGGGIAGYWGDIRSAGQVTSKGNITTGAMQFMHVVDSLILASNQGATRRGSYAAYMDISHPEIKEFITMRKGTGGDVHRKNLNLFHGVNIPDAFMFALLNNESWDLVDPNSKQICDTVAASELWELLLFMRLEKGAPYIHFIDRSNEFLHPDLKKKGLKISTSNLCSEITLPTTIDRSAVCCLSSPIMETWDEWKDHPGFIEDCVEFLDNVLEDFIQTAPPQLWRAVASAKGERSIGLGTMGFHSYLQKNMIPWESPITVGINDRYFSYLQECCQRANHDLAKRRGPAEDLETDRFANMMAIAPNASISLLADTSPSIEPWDRNIFSQPTSSGAFTMKNRHLDKLLHEKYSTDEVPKIWQSIATADGSVQHLPELSQWEKDVFKTAFEIDQRSIIHLAARRQKFICQSQSLNLFFAKGVPLDYLNDAHVQAWSRGCKTLYYVRSESVRSAEMVTFDADAECVSCEG